MSVATLTSENYQSAISGDKPVIIDFYADWCGPCKMIAPLFEELSKQRTDIAFYKMNVDNCTDITSKLNIAQVPTFAGFKGGQLIRSVVGARPKEEILALVE